MPTLQPRLYQETIFHTATLHNTLVVLPTGLGKTHIAMMLAQQRINQYPDKKILILAPTRPLVDQHAQTFAEFIPDAESLGVTLSGRIKPEKRGEVFDTASYIFSTPQTIENDLLAKRISLDEVCLLVLDEAHRSTGDYAYVYITEQYRRQANFERILALTASPGSDKATIQEVIDNAGVEKIELRTHEDPDVKPYVQDMEITYDELELVDDITTLVRAIERVIRNRLTIIKNYGYIDDVKVTKTKLLRAQREVQAMLRDGQQEQSIWHTLSLLAEVMKAQHAQELAETQSVSALISYMEQLLSQAERGQSKAVKNLMSDPEFKAVHVRAKALAKRGIEHPKLARMLALVKLELTKKKDAKIIIFNQYRDTASQLVKKLGKKARLFVGQQKKGETGLSQKEQKAMLAEFRDGQFPILVATAVGEEGLDIPSVDFVLFYEPIPSAIRTIQRRGRTGRHDTGRVVVLLAKGTRDEAYRWAAHHKEKRMFRALRSFAKTITPKQAKSQSVLEEFAEKDQPEIVADAREKGGLVLKELQNLGADLRLKQLDVGDYVLSKRVCVEFKTAEDFVNSLLDGRLLEQMRSLKRYDRPIMIVQGADWYSQRNVHPNAIRGAFSAIAVSYGVPILVTQNEKDTAALLQTIARREKEGGISGAQFASSHATTLDQHIVQVVASMPNVGPQTAVKLLVHFGSLKKLVNAKQEQLTQIEGVGKKRADDLIAFFEQVYED